MNLFWSILSSFIILVVFWSVALFQSNIAIAFEERTIENTITNEQLLNNTRKIDKAKQEQLTKISVSGIKQEIALNQINKLWQQFNNDEHLHRQLKKQPAKIYVVYQKLSDNYQKALVTIGYDIQIIDRDNTIVTQLNTQDLLILKPLKKYTDSELTEAFEKINYSKPIDYILEIHSLDLSGETIASQLLIAYQ